MSLAWAVADPWTLSASWGVAYRMPTVTELYQAVTTGTQLTVPNPNLKPEHANSYELAAERTRKTADEVRLSLFREDIGNALLSQSAPLVAGSTTLYSYVQNVDATRVQGVELVADQKDALVDGLDLVGQRHFRGFEHPSRTRLSLRRWANIYRSFPGCAARRWRRIMPPANSP